MAEVTSSEEGKIPGSHLSPDSSPSLSCPTEALEGPQERNPENNTATSLWLRRKPSLNTGTGSQTPVALGYGYQGSPRGRVDGEVRPPIWPRFWPCPRLSMSSRAPTCHGTGAAVGPAGTTVLWDVLVPGDAGIVDTVHVSPVPVLGEISWGQVFMRPRIGPGKRSWQWKPILEYMGPSLPQPGPQIQSFLLWPSSLLQNVQVSELDPEEAPAEPRTIGS